MTVGPADVAAALHRDRQPLAADLPDLPDLPGTTGMYAFHAPPAVWRDLWLRHPGDDRPLYVGKADSDGGLAGRVLTEHLGTPGRPRKTPRPTSVTGWSTVRRSLAALLRDRRGYTGVPRNPAKPGRYRNYGLAPHHDADLTVWMRNHLTLSVWPPLPRHPRTPDEAAALADLPTLEYDIRHLVEAPLNVDDDDPRTEWTDTVCQAREVLAEQARRRGSPGPHD